MDILDAHCHIIDPNFPLVRNNGFLPEAFTVDDYRQKCALISAETGCTFAGGVIVSGSFQAFDTTYLTEALTHLGPTYAGVVNLAPTANDAEIERLAQAGVRATRCNLYRGGSMTLAEVEALAHRVHHLVGWHTEFYLDAADLPELAPMLRKVPQATIDHFGMSDAPDDLLASLVGDGLVVKATGLGRTDVTDPAALMQRLLRANPGGVVFGTDLPSTRARVPFSADDIARIAHWAEDARDDVFAANARRLYRVPRTD